MKGLWRLPTRTIDPGLALTVYDGVAGFLIPSITGFAIWRKSKQWPEAWVLHTGMVLLSMWFFLHWIDTLVHHRHLAVLYSYILMDPISKVFRTLSDVFIIWGIWKVFIRYKYLRPNFVERPVFAATTIAATVLGILALFHLCFLWGLTFAWLSFSDVATINAIAEGTIGFELAFTTLQFVSAIPTAIGISKYIYKRNEYYSKQVTWAHRASVALVLRSFCEVIIVGQLERWPAHIQDIARGRDVTYGLFSLCLVFSMAFAVPSKPDEDPIVEKAEGLRECMRFQLLSKIQEVSEFGSKTAPSISSVLDGMEERLRSGNDRYSQEFCTKQSEIRRLRKLYAKWEPIYKWEGDRRAS